MQSRPFTKLASLFVAVVGLVLAASAVSSPAAEHPNIVFIMADDMGYGDPGCYNRDSKAPTPAIDALAAAGMRFTDAHSPAAVCVPTRYGLLTGRYPFRTSLNVRSKAGIEPGRMTVGSLLQKHGYATACVGKWHLGFDGGPNLDYARPLRGGPVDRGFDRYFGIPASLDIPPYYYIRDARAVAPPSERVAASSSQGVTPIQGAFWRAGGVAPGFKHARVLPRLTREAVGIVSDHAKQTPAKPLFLYVALPAPHTPWLPIEPFAGKSKAGDYGDFVVQVDNTVGRILSALETHKLADNTLVIFTSDNGPVWYAADTKRYAHRSVGPLRGMKGDAWEGGHRMPFIVRWPGRVKAGSISGETICHTDLLATVAAIVGDKLPRDAGEDSFSFLPALLGQQHDGPLRPGIIVQSSGRVLSIREGPWKLIPALGSGGFSKPRRIKPTPGGPQGQLYNLQTDLGETKNVWSERPEVVAKLTKQLETIKSQGRSRP